jgi:hypothetical protein
VAEFSKEREKERERERERESQRESQRERETRAPPVFHVALMAAHGWQVTFCEVHVMVHVASDDAEHHEEHLLQHWWWIMEQVWRSNLKIGLVQSNGERYSGDVLFMEDDLEVADDFVAVVKHLVRLKSKPIPETPWMAEVAALGGWGGEMMINAHKRWKPSLAVCVCVCVCACSCSCSC